MLPDPEDYPWFTIINKTTEKKLMLTIEDLEDIQFDRSYSGGKHTRGLAEESNFDLVICAIHKPDPSIQFK